MKRLFAVILVAVATIAAASAQDLRRHVPRTARHNRTVSVERTVSFDTIAPAADSIVVAGYEKPLRAVKESMFVTNRLSRPVVGLSVTIDYLDTKGRQLHQATHDIDVIIPAGETRRVEVPAFDRQGLYYYRLSPVPRGTRQATAFDVKVTVNHVIHPLLTQPQ